MTYTTVTAFAPLLVLFLANSAGSVSYAGDGTSGVLMWGAQLESGSFSTSYMPTGATTFQRNPDVASVSTQAFPYNSAAGTLVLNASFLAAQDNAYLASLNDGTASNIISSRRFSDNSLYVYVATGGAAQWDQGILATVVTTGATFKHGLAFATNDGSQSINGGAVSSDTPPLTVPSVNTLNIGGRNGGLNSWNGHIRQITYLPRRISNAELIARTA